MYINVRHTDSGIKPKYCDSLLGSSLSDCYGQQKDRP